MNKNKIQLIQLNNLVTDFITSLLENYFNKIKKDPVKYSDDLDIICNFIDKINPKISKIEKNTDTYDLLFKVLKENSSQYFLYLSTIDKKDLNNIILKSKLNESLFVNSLMLINDITKDIIFSLTKIDNLNEENETLFNDSCKDLKFFIENIKYDDLINHQIGAPKIIINEDKILKNKTSLSY